MINVTMLARNRHELTYQAIQSLFDKNPFTEFNLTIIDDDSLPSLEQAVGLAQLDIPQYDYWLNKPNIVLVRISPHCGVTGRLRNLSVYFSEKHFGRGDFLYLSDNDAFFKLHSLMILQTAYNHVKGEGFRLLGPYRHPYHLPIALPIEMDANLSVVETHHVVGIGHFMEWSTWDRFGPLDAHAKGTNQSEDTKFANDIRAAGYRVGSVEPALIVNCGLTDTQGKLCVGHEYMPKSVPNVTVR